MAVHLADAEFRCLDIRKARDHPDIIVYTKKLNDLPPLPTERSPAKQTCVLSYHTVDLHPGYGAIGVP